MTSLQANTQSQTIVAVFPKDHSESLTSALALTGAVSVPIDDLDEVAAETAGDWSLLIIELGDEPMRRLRRIAELDQSIGVPVLIAAEPAHFPLLARTAGVADFLATPIQPDELAVRIERLMTQSTTDDVLHHHDLELNTLTYQASVAEVPIDLTFMEYELLRFFIQHPRRVWTREQLLSKVWGYDYFGGARTVDVHVRRLRAKLGEERASWISTVRSVGYRFG